MVVSKALALVHAAVAMCCAYALVPALRQQQAEEAQTTVASSQQQVADFSIDLQMAASTSNVTLDEAVAYTELYRPKEDGVTGEYLKANAKYALMTQAFPYAHEVPRELFLSSVLPYAHFDEKRDAWRPFFYQTLRPYVHTEPTLQAAADAIWPVWSHAFGKVLTFKGNMTPQIMAPVSEVLSAGHASCTGFAIFIANCYRSVGIPARVVGTNAWNRPLKGNHNWVEVWTGSSWNFMDAVPGSARVAWNQTWFVDQAKKAQSSPIEYAILSPVWGPTADTVYAMSWRPPPVPEVPAIDVTGRYQDPAHRPSIYWPPALGAVSICLIVVVALVAARYSCSTGGDVESGKMP